MNEEKIKEVMGLVIDVAASGIDYGASDGKTARLENLKKLHISEEAVESKLRELLAAGEGKVGQHE